MCRGYHGRGNGSFCLTVTSAVAIYIQAESSRVQLQSLKKYLCFYATLNLSWMVIGGFALKLSALNSKSMKQCKSFECMIDLTKNGRRPSFVLQAETEEEMKEWMGAFVSAKRSSVDSEHINSRDSTRTYSPTNERISDASSISLATTNGSVERQDSSVVMLSTSYDKGNISLSTSTSLTPSLVCEAARQQINANSSPVPNSPATPNQSFVSSTVNSNVQINNSSSTNTSSSWGIPWTLVPSMFSSSGDDSERPPASPMSPTFPSSIAGNEYDGHPVVWPLHADDSNTPKPDMTGYTAALEARNSELRNLFGGVSASEVVIEGKN